MNKIILSSLIVSAFTLCGVNASTKSDTQISPFTSLNEIKKQLYNIPTSYHEKPLPAQNSNSTSNTTPINLVNEANPLLYVNTLDFSNKKSSTPGLSNTLASKTEGFEITGFSFAIDPNLACIVETRDPKFSVTFVDSNGQKKRKKFELLFNTIGLKFQIGFNIDLIYFVNTDLNFYNTDKEIKLGTGFEISISSAFPSLNLAYIPFANAPGGIIIASLAFLSAELFSIITGGTLKPVPA